MKNSPEGKNWHIEGYVVIKMRDKLSVTKS